MSVLRSLESMTNAVAVFIERYWIHMCVALATILLGVWIYKTFF